MTLLDDFIETFNQPSADAVALKKLEGDITRLIKELHHDPPGLHTWEAVALFVLYTARHLAEYHLRSEGHHLHLSIRQIKDAFDVSKTFGSPVVGTDILSRLPPELLGQIVDKLDIQDQKAFSLVSTSSWQALDGFRDSLFMEWALRSLRALNLSMISIMSELMSFHQKNKHLGLKIMRSFNRISTKLLTIEVSHLHPELFNFLQLLVQSKPRALSEAERPLRIVFSRGPHRAIQEPTEVSDQMLTWANKDLSARSSPPFAFYYQGDGAGLVRNHLLYLSCTRIDIGDHDESRFNNVLRLILTTQANHVPALREVRLRSRSNQEPQLAVSLPTGLERVMLVKVKLPSLWLAALSLRQLSNLIIEGMPFTGTANDLNAIVASRHWRTLSFSENGLPNEFVNALLRIEVSHGHTSHHRVASATHAAVAQLKILRLREDKLIAEPQPQFQLCSHLRHLDVSGNRDLGDGLSTKHLPATLEVLLAAKCGIHIARPDKKQPAPTTHDRLDFKTHLTHLQILDLSGNEGITYLGAYLAPEKLRTLCIAICCLSEIDPDLRKSSIRKLDLSYNDDLGKNLNTAHLPALLEELSVVQCGIEVKAPKSKAMGIKTSHFKIPWSKFRKVKMPKIKASEMNVAEDKVSESSGRKHRPANERFDFRTNCPTLATLDVSFNYGIKYFPESMVSEALRKLYIHDDLKCTIDPSVWSKNVEIGSPWEYRFRERMREPFADSDFLMG